MTARSAVFSKRRGRLPLQSSHLFLTSNHTNITHTYEAMYYAILMLVMEIAQEGGSEREVETQTRLASTWELKEKYFIVTAYISCNSTPLDTPPHPLAGRWNDVKQVVLTGCYPPAHPDPPALAHLLAAGGIRPPRITHLQLRDIPPDVKLNASFFKGMGSVVDLMVQAAGQDPANQLDGKFFQTLPSMSWLSIENEALNPFEKNEIIALTLQRGRSLDAFGDCEDLGSLNLREWRLPKNVNSTSGWLSKCKIRHLKAESMDLDSLRTVLSDIGARNLFDLKLPSNELTPSDLHNLLKITVNNIGYLNVSDNNITDIYDVLETQTALRRLDLSRNMLTDFMATVHAVFKSLKLRDSLDTLILDYNPLHDYCNWEHNPWLLTTGRTPPLKLKFLSLVGTNTSRVCFPDWKLSYLNLSTNNMKVLQFGMLPLIGNFQSLVVDVRDNPLREVHFREADYNALTDTSRPWSEKMTVHTDILPLFDCDCKNGWLGRALRKDRLVLPAGARCRGGGELHAVPPDSLECDLEPCEPCTCRQQWKSRTVIMHCDALDLRDIPSLPNMGELHLRGNHIDTILAENLSTTLTLLDVRDNNISRMDKAAADALFNLVERRVWLSRNPLICDCDNWPLLGALQNHRIQVVDYGNVTCVDGSLLDNLSQEQLCSVTSTVAWVWLFVGSAVLMGLLAILGALYMRYDRQLKVWLYARGWCLSCVREEELDADREYDAFVSFAHGDYEFVASHLLSGMEDGPHGYKVCVHYRDWVPGEMISTQITRSVASSRRTVIVLSANFVQSMWGMLEFRAAHVSALTEGRVRVLVVALEDTPPAEELPEELRLYLRSTTYLRWNDPLFWKKLHYALPHRARRDERIVPQEEHVRETMPPACGFEMMLFEQ